MGWAGEEPKVGKGQGLGEWRRTKYGKMEGREIKRPVARQSLAGPAGKLCS